MKIEIEGKKYPIFDLTPDKGNQRDKALQYKRDKNLLDINKDGLKAGDHIHFISGYNLNLVYKAEVNGFDQEGNIYLIWDPVHYPINPSRLLSPNLIPTKLAK